MTLADAAANYARHCQRNWTRRFLRFAVLNSHNDNPSRAVLLPAGATGGGSAFNNAAPNPINDARGDGAERFTTISSFSFHEADNADGAPQDHG